MKLQAITFTALIALTGTASANWFDGFNNGNGYGTAASNGNTAGYNPSVASVVAPTQNYTQLKAMWEAQRKQADEMLKRIEAAQKAAIPKS
ncbi:MAG TPA: hypothetical protein EYH38_07430 [Leucothrix sp.]|nr:hypothetical protein [Leucothrix sp.]